jgi:hypothetical protein
MEYTHSMPYYVTNKQSSNSDVNEYQYIPISSEAEWDSGYEAIVEYFSQKKVEGGYDPFDKIFGDVSKTQFKSKRFNRKYSRFLLGDNVSKSSTLFRGVKFEITELKNGEEVKTGKYNGYRFSFVYVPEFYSEGTEKRPVYFIKNDDYKFIVGLVFFDVLKNESTFNKAYSYGAGTGALEIHGEIDNGESSASGVSIGNKIFILDPTIYTIEGDTLVADIEDTYNGDEQSMTLIPKEINL